MGKLNNINSQLVSVVVNDKHPKRVGCEYMLIGFTMFLLYMIIILIQEEDNLFCSCFTKSTTFFVQLLYLRVQLQRVQLCLSLLNATEQLLITISYKIPDVQEILRK